MKRTLFIFSLSLITIIAITILFYLILIYIKVETGEAGETNLETTLFYYILGVFFSLLLILIAYTKLGEANRQSRISYLIRIDERWASTEIVQAREVIHLLYLDARELEPRYKSREETRHIIGKGIMELHSNREKIPEFIRLLNFLDFLETVGYLHDTNAISIVEIRELLGNSIVYYFEIFKLFIIYRREEAGDEKFYENFEKLYKKIKNYSGRKP